MISRGNLLESDLDLKFVSLISQIMSLGDPRENDFVSKVILLISQIISLFSSMDLESQPKQESKLMSLFTRTISFFNSMDMDSQPKPLQDLILLISQKISHVQKPDLELKSLVGQKHFSPRSSIDTEIMSLFTKSLKLEPEPELISLIRQIVFVGIYMDSKWKKLISLCPQVQVIMEEGKFQVQGQVSWSTNNKWECLPFNWVKFRLPGVEDDTHFVCHGCNGENHKEYNKAPLEIKYPLHPKHSLRLVLLHIYSQTRECYCCDDDLRGVFYYCATCDFSIKLSCVEKSPVLAIDLPKWHEHTLALFPSQASLTCNLCALTHSRCPFYICPPCDFVIHQKCFSLPRVIRISRHPHRISFTPSFEQGDWSCGVCRRKIENDYGGYSCIKKGCLYTAHSKCATQRNVWDGIELEGEPEELEEEELDPFVTISEGIIQHFSHQHHHLRLDENTCNDYDENKQCQACITPIYFGNFYSCMQCGFILHETCAKLSRKIYHPIHPHMLTLVGPYNGVVNYSKDECSACPWFCKAGFFYECRKEGCDFQLHVQCATISEPLVHKSHMHPLFLTSKPGEWRICYVCGLSRDSNTNETFNCIECNFALCFICATLPEKVRYKHDKHILNLSYGEETSTLAYWCEACESKINPKERFYMCDEYCCVTLHIECMLGVDLYMKPGSSGICYGSEVAVLPNNNNMSRPICSYCMNRCRHKVVFQTNRSIFCSKYCIR